MGALQLDLGIPSLSLSCRFLKNWSKIQSELNKIPLYIEYTLRWQNIGIGVQGERLRVLPEQGRPKPRRTWPSRSLSCAWSLTALKDLISR